ncbi:MAG: hypothetical protein LBJ92_01800 [Holosporales bacterium]|jgi:hypothetical protein|nr:hypothetical protein [Holosporales bacterium]
MPVAGSTFRDDQELDKIFNGITQRIGKIEILYEAVDQVKAIIAAPADQPPAQADLIMKVISEKSINISEATNFEQLESAIIQAVIFNGPNPDTEQIESKMRELNITDMNVNPNSK